MIYYIVVLTVGEHGYPVDVLSFDNEEARDKQLSRFDTPDTNPDFWKYTYHAVDVIK